MLVMYVHGFMGSSLAFDPAGTDVYYPSLSALASNHPLTSALDVDGVSPYPVFGKQLFPAVALQEGLLQSVLTPQLPQGSVVSGFAWDWRKDIGLAAAQLYSQIEAKATAEEPVNIVAHSAGCLVSIAAAAIAAGKGKKYLVRRIVCLGGPFQGSYVPLQALQADGIQALEAIAPPLSSGFVQALRFFLLPIVDILLFSWPGMVQLFPFLKGSWSAGDPQRPTLFQPGTFPNISPAYASSRLTAASLLQGTVVSALQIVQGTGLLVLGLGTGWSTVDRLSQSPARVPPGPFIGTAEGDGVVTRQSAELVTEDRFVSTWSHSELIPNFAASGALATALLQGPVVTLPPVEVQVEELPMTLVPLTNAALIALLNSTHRFRELYTVVGFTGANPAAPYVFTMDKAARRAHRFARVISSDVGGVYLFNGTAWFYVPSPKIESYFT